MAYLEELLPEFRKGAKIRCNDWLDDVYIFVKNGEILPSHPSLDVKDDNDLISNKWEFYQEPEPDWNYIIKNKCLCWFWDDYFDSAAIGLLREVGEEFVWQDESGNTAQFKHCRPVRRDEISFYEDEKKL